MSQLLSSVAGNLGDLSSDLGDLHGVVDNIDNSIVVQCLK